MFTGIVTDIGEIIATERRGDLRARIASSFDPDSIDIGASIACSGVCLTVVDRGPVDGGAWFDVDISAETLSKTTLGDWADGARVNLERSLRVGDELGGHVVSGHVDGICRVQALLSRLGWTPITPVARLQVGSPPSVKISSPATPIRRTIVNKKRHSDIASCTT